MRACIIKTVRHDGINQQTWTDRQTDMYQRLSPARGQFIGRRRSTALEQAACPYTTLLVLGHLLST